MTIVAVVSLAAAIFIPRHLKKKIRDRQRECHQNLATLWKLENVHHLAHATYTHDLRDLNWAPTDLNGSPAGNRFHQYEFMPYPPADQGYIFQCVGNIDSDALWDHASIDEKNNLRQVADDRIE